MSKDVKKRNSWKYMTEREFYGIKAMQNAGVSANAVSKVTGRGAGTVTYIFKSKNFDEYRELTKRHSQLYKLKNASKKAKAEKVEAQVELAIQEEAEAEKPTNTTDELLERIAVSLENLVAAWEARPEAPVKKRGLF